MRRLKVFFREAVIESPHLTRACLSVPTAARKCLVQQRHLVFAQIAAVTVFSVGCGEFPGSRTRAAVKALESLTAEHPYREPLWAQLITAYYVTERQSDALGAYRRLKTTLAEGLGIDPGPTVSTLHERILRQEPLGANRAALATFKRNAYRNDDSVPDVAVTDAVIVRLRDKSGRRYEIDGETTLFPRDVELHFADAWNPQQLVVDVQRHIVGDVLLGQ